MAMLQHIGLIRVLMISLTSDLLRYFVPISPSLSIFIVRKPAHILGMHLDMTIYSILFLVHDYSMLVTNIESQ